MKFVICVWEDSTHIHFGWNPLESVKDSFSAKVIIYTPGVVLEETETYIVVAQSIDCHKTAISNSLRIPKSQLIEVIDISKTVNSKLKKYESDLEISIDV